MKTLEIVKNLEIAAPIDIVFETILEQMGPLNETTDGTRLPMKLEPWPGGRWYRDLGNERGHCWGFVQSYRPNDLLEIQGPLFMSAPAISHILYRLKEENGVTHVAFSHRAIGDIPEAFLDGTAVQKGWGHLLGRIQTVAEQLVRTRQ